MTEEERVALVDGYLRYLEHDRLPAELPTTKEELKALAQELDALAESNPHFGAWEELDYEIGHDPECAWTIILEILTRCQERDLGSMGAGPLETLLWRKPSEFVDRFDERIRADTRFRDAFTNVRMGGVPLSIQRRLNGALVHTGIDASTLMEFDETIPEDP